MFSVYNQPYLNFDPYVDLNGLLDMRQKISAFIALNSHLIRPTKYTTGNFPEQQSLGILDYYSKYSTSTDPIIKDLIAKDVLGTYIAFEEDVTHGSMSLNLRYCKSGYQNKHLSTECQSTAEDNEFDFFYQWLDAQNIFAEYGRVNIFINHPGSYSEIHKDYPDDSYNKIDQFLWINLTDRKKFFILNDKEKIYIPCHCSWFNTNNYHGTDPVTQSCYSIRVDGVFSESFKNKFK